MSCSGDNEVEMTTVFPLEDRPISADDRYPDDLDDIPEDEEVPNSVPYIVPPGDAEPAPLDTERICEEFTLFQCARNGYVDKATTLLKTERVRAEINNDDEEGLTPLHYAARYNHFDMLKLLLEHNADVNSGDREKLTPLMYACRIKRKRKKSRKSQLVFGDAASCPLPSPIKERSPSMSMLGGKVIDKDASSIHYLIDNGADVTHKDEYGLTALHHAALRGDEVACEQLLFYATEESPLVNAKDVQLMTPLHTAVCQSQTDIVHQLLKAGADVFCRDEELSTPLHEAATIGDTKIGKLVMDSCKHDKLKQEELVSGKDEDGNTSLMLAVESGKYNFVNFMIKRGASINTTNKMNMTPLHLAAIKGELRIVELLVSKGAKIAVLNQEQQTSLHKACLFNNVECVKFLLDSGSNIEAKDRDNFTPLLLAASYGHAKTVELLLQREADASAEDKNDKTAVFLAAEENKLEVLEVLLRFPAMKNLINHRDECNNGPLHIAAQLGHISIVRCLLGHGALLSAKNDMEQTPMHMAAENGWTLVVREIAVHDKNALNDGDENSNTALHLAALGGHIRLVETLLDHGAGPEIRNSSLRTPIGVAAEQGHLKVIKLLVGADSMIDIDDKLGLTPLLVAAQNGHAEVVDYLLNKKANANKCDLYGRNCLDLAVLNDHQEVAVEILKSKSWENALRNSCTEDGLLCTPLRRLIRKMPEVAEMVFDKCIEVKKPDDGSQTKLTDKFEVVFDFEFLDDLYSVHTWGDKSALHQKRREKLKELHASQDGEEAVLHHGFSWDKLKPFKRRDRTLVPYTNDSDVFRNNHPMLIMVQSQRLELLDHPLVTALRRHKWCSFGRFFYYISFIAYVIFLIFLTGYILVTPPPFQIAEMFNASDTIGGDSDCEKFETDGGSQHLLAKIGKYFILILAVINLIKEISQAFHTKLNYLSWENFLEVMIFVCSLLLVLDVTSCQKSTGYRYPWQWNFGAVAIVLAWIGLVMFIQKFPKIGIYVVMFNNILHTFFKFFIVFLLFIIAFGLGFFCLLQNQTPYATSYHAIIRTAVMMIGEFDYNDIFHGEDDMHYWLAYVLFCAFLLIMTIIIMNLLVGLAVDDIKGVQEQAAVKRIAMKVNLVLDVERIHLNFTSRWYKERLSEFYSSAEEVATTTTHTEEFEDQIQKSQKKVLKKMDKIKSTVKSLKNDMNKISEMLEAVMRAQNIQLNAEEASLSAR